MEPNRNATKELFPVHKEYPHRQSNGGDAVLFAYQKLVEACKDRIIELEYENLCLREHLAEVVLRSPSAMRGVEFEYSRSASVDENDEARDSATPEGDESMDYITSNPNDLELDEDGRFSTTSPGPEDEELDFETPQGDESMDDITSNPNDLELDEDGRFSTTSPGPEDEEFDFETPQGDESMDDITSNPNDLELNEDERSSTTSPVPKDEEFDIDIYDIQESADLEPKGEMDFVKGVGCYPVKKIEPRSNDTRAIFEMSDLLDQVAASMQKSIHIPFVHSLDSRCNPDTRFERLINPKNPSKVANARAQVAKAIYVIKNLLRALLDVAKMAEPDDELDGEHLRDAWEGNSKKTVEILEKVYKELALK